MNECVAAAPGTALGDYARIELEAGPPVDGATASAESLEALVRALRGDAR